MPTQKNKLEGENKDKKIGHVFQIEPDQQQQLGRDRESLCALVSKCQMRRKKRSREAGKIKGVFGAMVVG